MAQIDQALIDSAVSHGYTREEAIAHYYGTQQSSNSPSVDWALKQGQQNIADQPASMEKLKNPDIKGAATEMIPVAARVGKEAAQNLFQNLTADDIGEGVAGVYAAANGYEVYKTLKDKIIGGNTPPPPPPPPPAIAPAVSPAAPATPAAPAAPVQTLQQRLGLVPKVELSPEELRKQKLTAAGAVAEQQMKANAAPISAEGATPLIPAPPPPTDTPPVKVEPPPAAPIQEPPSASPVPTPDTAIVNNQTGATPADKAVAIVNAPETSATRTTTTTETPKVASAVEPKINLPEGTRPSVAQAINDFASKHPEAAANLAAKGQVFIPGPMAGDNRAYSSWGREGRLNIINAFNQGNPIGVDQNLTNLMSHSTQGVPPSVAHDIFSTTGPEIQKGLTGNRGRLGEPSIFTNEGKFITSDLTKKMAKGVGIGGIVAALADVANAKNANEARSIAGETALNTIPGVGPAAMLYMKGAGEGENADIAFKRRMEVAKQLGAGNRGKAFDPRIPYNSSLSDIGIPPPYGR
jgi:hypothetical protein